MEIKTIDNQQSLQLNDKVFADNYNESLVHQIVVAFMNKAREGNSAQKTRSEVSGGGRKPWKQKGTGRARAGTIRSPIWRSGGVTFASKKRDYAQKVNKKMYKKAICGIFSELLRTNSVSFVNEFKCESNRTKDFLTKMKELKIDNALIILDEVGECEYLASRNLLDFDVCDAISLDPVHLLKYKSLLITAGAAKKIEEQLQ